MRETRMGRIMDNGLRFAQNGRQRMIRSHPFIRFAEGNPLSTLTLPQHRLRYFQIRRTQFGENFDRASSVRQTFLRLAMATSNGLLRETDKRMETDHPFRSVSPFPIRLKPYPPSHSPNTACASSNQRERNLVKISTARRA